MTDLLDNPQESVRESFHRAVALYRGRRNHPNWLTDQWAETENFAPVSEAPRYVDQLAIFASSLVAMDQHKAGNSILSRTNQLIASVAGNQLLISELTKAELATLKPT